MSEDQCSLRLNHNLGPQPHPCCPMPEPINEQRPTGTNHVNRAVTRIGSRSHRTRTPAIDKVFEHNTIEGRSIYENSQSLNAKQPLYIRSHPSPQLSRETPIRSKTPSVEEASPLQFTQQFTIPFPQPDRPQPDIGRKASLLTNSQ